MKKNRCILPIYDFLFVSLQVFVLMQFDPGTEYRPDWGFKPGGGRPGGPGGIRPGRPGLGGPGGKPGGPGGVKPGGGPNQPPPQPQPQGAAAPTSAGAAGGGGGGKDDKS